MITKAIREYVKSHSHGQKGQGIVEYALILAFVVLLAIALNTDSGIVDSITSVFSNVNTQISNPGGGGGQQGGGGN